MKLDDVMTTQEAAERWNVTADSLKQNCRGRVKNGFLEGEFRKSGKCGLSLDKVWNVYMVKK